MGATTGAPERDRADNPSRSCCACPLLTLKLTALFDAAQRPDEYSAPRGVLSEQQYSPVCCACGALRGWTHDGVRCHDCDVVAGTLGERSTRWDRVDFARAILDPRSRQILSSPRRSRRWRSSRHRAVLPTLPMGDMCGRSGRKRSTHPCRMRTPFNQPVGEAIPILTPERFGRRRAGPHAIVRKSDQTFRLLHGNGVGSDGRASLGQVSSVPRESHAAITTDGSKVTHP
jgi:hypothetical protein